MALRKKLSNEKRPDGEKYAEIQRVRLGTRLPVYLPQRVTDDLVRMLAEFKKKAKKIGIRQFVVQTHFESPAEITTETRTSLRKLVKAGWIVTNQLVLSTAASRRGHAAKLRQVLGEIGVVPYYTFSVKGFKENSHAFTPNARAVQEQVEEKTWGEVPPEFHDRVRSFPNHARKMSDHIADLKKCADIPFLASDRIVMNLPGVGKSLTFRVIGIVGDGRRILEFDHDVARTHSPITTKMGKVVIVESKSIGEYLDQLDSMGEDIAEYQSIYGYSISTTQPRLSIYDYPEYDYQLTEELTNYAG
jgi:lysine 2,3-aminomutase